MKWSVAYVFLSVLCLSAAVYWRGLQGASDPQAIVVRIEESINREIDVFQEEFALIEGSAQAGTDWPVVTNAFFLSDSAAIVRWNTNKPFPESLSVIDDSLTYQRSGTNHYLVKRKLMPGNLSLTGFLPLQTGYPIQNQFLANRLNGKIFEDMPVSLEPSGEVFPVLYRGRPLLMIAVRAGATVTAPGWAGWILLLAGITFLTISVTRLCRALEKKNWIWPSVFLVFVALLALRLVMVYGRFPGVNTNWTIFNPTVFASSRFNDSIGNLLLNTIALFAVAAYAYVLTRGKKMLSWRRKPPLVKAVVIILLLVLCFAAQLLPFLYLETIYHNSAITPDISQQLKFDSTRVCALLCIVLSSAAGFYFLFAFFRAALHLAQANFFLFLSALSVAAIVFFGYHLATDRNYEVPFLLTIVNLLALALSSATRRLKYLVSGTFSLTILELFIFGLQASLAIRELSIERERNAMVKFANTFLIERDILGEYLLDQAISKIEADAFIQQQIVNPFSRRNAIEQKIRHSHLNAYFDRYETQIHLFDNRGRAVDAGSLKDLPALIQDFVPLAEGTGYRGIYIIRNPGNEMLRRYLAVVPVKFHVSGFIVLDLTLRQVLPVSVFPKLLLDSRFSDYAKIEHYSFAVFNNGRLISSAGEFNYQQPRFVGEVTNPSLYREGIWRNGFMHLGVEEVSGQVAVVSVKQYSFFDAATNFSFYFLTGLTCILIIVAMVSFPVIRRKPLTYSNQIQLYVYLAIVLPLTVLATTTLRINALSEADHLENLNERQAENLASSLAAFLSDSLGSLREEIMERAQGGGVDITVFSRDGIMLASSQPDIFSNQLFSRFINPMATQEITQGNFLFTLDEQIGSLMFRNTYAAVRAPSTGEVLGIVSVPFFASQELIEQGQLRLVSNILGVLVIVMLLFYLISFIALNWLTAPLKTIAASLQRTTLSGVNRKLTWKSKDEIGAMVKEYNNMIDNLARSRQELERRQREATWREMARQVAHEIKNPLTPIKLTLQQLEKSFLEGRSDKDKTIQSIQSLLKQVDILNEIASSFSAFAQMPEPRPEKINVVELLEEAVSLFADSKDGVIVFTKPAHPVFIMADRKLFSRIFSNIVLNAFQAKPEGRELKVTIAIALEGSGCTISFSDNGRGMETHVIEKIFIPYFSTKEAGTGLGLAIAKQGVEQIGGRIWCESHPNEGTVFYISLPLL